MTKTGRRRLGREAMFELPSFGSEPIYFEPTPCPSDTLYSGSEDEYYESPAARSRCYEDQARNFLEGRRPFLVSASLKGPFDEGLGWNNPWKGRGGRAPGSPPKRLRGRESGLPVSAIASVPSVDSAPHREVAAWRVDAKSPIDPENEFWHSSTTKMDTGAHATNWGWPRRKTLKRTKSIDDEVFAVSPTTAVHRDKFRKLVSSTQCVELAVEVVGNQNNIDDDNSRQGDLPKIQKSPYEENPTTLSLNANDCRTIMEPADLPPVGTSPKDDQSGDQGDTGLVCRKQKGIKLGILNNDKATSIALQNVKPALGVQTDYDTESLQSQAPTTPDHPGPWNCSNDNTTASAVRENIALQGEAAMPDSLGITGTLVAQTEVPVSFLGGTNPHSFDHRDTAECDVLIRNPFNEWQGSSNAVVGEESVERQTPPHNVANHVTTADRLDQPLQPQVTCPHSSSQLSNTASNSVKKLNGSDLPAEEENGPGSVDQPDGTDTAEMKYSQLATQDQSPWARSPFTMPSTPRRTTADMHAEDTERPPDFMGIEPDRLQVNESMLKTVAPIQTQSPWLKESPFGPTLLGPDHRAPSTISGDGSSIPIDTANDMRVTLDQNPWADKTSPREDSLAPSLPKAPTSPNSPSSPGFLSQTACEQLQGGSMPGPSTTPLPASLGTTPSTPETKRSSLPTPDLTVSIKSFRKFRSPTPTPPPRQRTKQPGGLKSVLVPPRSKRGARLSDPDRRVCFFLPEQEDNSGFPFTYLYDVKDDEEDPGENTPIGRHVPLQPTHGMQGGGTPSVAKNHGQRAISPPPRQSVMTEALPSEVQKFQGHFATVANRCQQGSSNGNPAGWATTYSARGSHLLSTVLNKLEAATADVFGSSPGHDTVVETSRLCKPSQRGSAIASCEKSNVWDGDKENMESQFADTEGQSAEHGCDERTVDDVQEVLENLGDFLGMWDVDTELSKATSG